VVLTPRRRRQVGGSNSADDGDKQARSPGRARRKPLTPSRAGMPGDPGATVVTNARAFYTPRAAAGATGTRHSPRPLFRGEVFLHNSGASRRENAGLYPAVIARSGATKQSILSSRGEMDCFASARNDVEGSRLPSPSRALEGEGRITWSAAKCETGWGDLSTRALFEGRDRHPTPPLNRTTLRVAGSRRPRERASLVSTPPGEGKKEGHPF